MSKEISAEDLVKIVTNSIQKESASKVAGESSKEVKNETKKETVKVETVEEEPKKVEVKEKKSTAEPKKESTKQKGSKPSKEIETGIKLVENIRIYSVPSKSTVARSFSGNVEVQGKVGEFTVIKYVKSGFGLVKGYTLDI